MSKPRRGNRFGLKPVSSRHHDALSRIDWRAFERLIADYYRDQGFEVDHSGTGASSRIGFDGGIDLKLRKNDEYVLVQCKHENVYKVTHNPVHELLGVMANEGASRAILITSGEFTQAALEAGRKLGHVQLIDGIQVRDLLADRLKTLSPSTSAENSGIWEKVGESYEPADGYRRRGPNRSRQSRDDSRDEVLIKIAVGIALMSALIFIVPGMVKLGDQSLLTKAGASAPDNRQPRPMPLPLAPHPYQPSSSPTTNFPGPVAVVPSPPPPTPQQLARAKAEQDRRDAETKRVLDNMNIPEMTHYRYSPLDQNKDKD